MNYKRLLAVDPSVTCSGWALYEIKSEKLQGIGKIRPLNADYSFAERIADLQLKIAALIKTLNLNNADILICEAPTTMKDPSAAIKVEQVRCAFETLARNNSVTVPGRINPRSVHFEVLGLKGKQLARNVIKDLAASTAIKLYGERFKKIGLEINSDNSAKYQDIIDAVLLGHLGIVKIKAAKDAKIEIQEYFQSLQTVSRRNSSWRNLAI